MKKKKCGIKIAWSILPALPSSPQDPEGPPEPPGRRKKLFSSPTAEYSILSKKTPSLTDRERQAIKAEWEALERRKQEFARQKTGEEITPIQVPTLPAIDWKAQPPIPAEKIDWSGQGEPLRVKPTLGSLVTAVSLAVSIIGAGAYFYWGVRTHIENQQAHVPANGIPWGVEASYETKKKAQQERDKDIQEIRAMMVREHESLKQDIVKAIRNRR